MSLLSTAALVGSFAASVAAHGYVQGIVAGGKYYTGYSPSFQYQDPPPVVIGWSDPEDQDNGFIAPDAYTSPDIICHKSATPAGTSAKVAAGSVVELQWTEWPESHHGPVMDYLAKCTGSCSDADKTALKFFKIDQGGLIDGSAPPGQWASDKLIANNNTWSVTIPSSIAPGNYVLRHEIIALHSAGDQNGAQNYPQCINLEITGSGSESPAGIPATQFYKPTDPGILINIYTTLNSYKIPGPAPIGGGGSSPQPSGSAPASSAGAPSSAASGSYGAPAPSSSAGAGGSAPASYPASPSSSVAGPGSSSAASWGYSASSGAAPGSSSASYPAYGSSSFAGPGSSSASYPASYPAPSGSSAGPASSSASYPASYGSYSYPASSGGAASGWGSYSGYSASSAGPASSSYASYSSGATTTCIKTITVSRKPSSSAGPGSSAVGSSYYPASSAASWSYPASSVGPASSASAPYECLSNVYGAIPTGYLSQTFPVMPTGSAFPSGAYPSGAYPSGAVSAVAAPEGTTFGDVLNWFKYMTGQVFNGGNHARDFNRR